MQTSKRPISLRHELKYLVKEALALELRDFVSSYLELDERGVGKPDFSYPVHTLYLDSDDRQLYWKAIAAPQCRSQLRIRYYSDHPESPVYLEIKHWTAESIVKHCAGIRRDAVPWVLSGQLPGTDSLVSRDSGVLVALQRFFDLQQRIDAKPVLRIAFHRECYVGQEGGTWLTMDRGIHCEVDNAVELVTDFAHPYLMVGHDVLLKLKFSERFPHWFQEMVETFNLTDDDWDLYLRGLSIVGDMKTE